MRSVILFDGVCSFCKRSVQFIIKRDPDHYLFFAALQSDAGKELRATYNLTSDMDSFLFIDKGTCYDKSTAALQVAKHLKGVWKIAFLFIIVPKPIRDGVYDYFAKRRYEWFEKSERCKLPTLEERERFL